MTLGLDTITMDGYVFFEETCLFFIRTSDIWLGES